MATEVGKIQCQRSKGRLGLLGGGVQLQKGMGPKCTFTTPLWGVTIHLSLSGTWHLKEEVGPGFCWGLSFQDMPQNLDMGLGVLVT